MQNISMGIFLMLICLVSFYSGYMNSVNDVATESITLGQHVKSCATSDFNPQSPELKARITSRVDAELRLQSQPMFPNAVGVQKDALSEGDALFPKSVSNFVSGMLRVAKEEFLRDYDFGVPNKRRQNNQDDIDAVILFNSQRSFPSNEKTRNGAAYGFGQGNQLIANATVSDALERCDSLNVIFVPLRLTGKENTFHECYVMVGDFESYHINRWMRLPYFEGTPKNKRQLDRSLPLRHVGRITLATKGVDELDLPNVWDDLDDRKKGFVMQHFDNVRTYLENVNTVLADLSMLLKEREIVRKNTVIVMTVNEGQSELLSNFICSARSRGFDTGSVLVFPTDKKSKILADGLGVASYYDEKNFGRLPSQEAKVYGDPVFCQMMFAKILSVAYMTLLGHDVLFQDVDIVWYKSPLSFFHNESNIAIQSFDLLFQHDGSAHLRYNPFSANSGFYYVRSNKRTQYLFTSFVYHGDLVRKTKSHQHVLAQLLLEHSSMFGLKIKVFDKLETDMFPGGFHYHQHWDTMRSIVANNSNAFIMHMSWTENKVNKLLFFRQLGDWFVNAKCLGGDVAKFIDGHNVRYGSLVDDCCSIEPILSCHFKDKPSIMPCPDAPMIDRKGKIFWINQ